MVTLVTVGNCTGWLSKTGAPGEQRLARSATLLVMQQNLVLILARDLADKLASATFVVDPEGTLLYFNEGAAEILGKSFADMGRMRMEEWSSAFSPVDADGRPLQPDELPLVIALKERRPVHRAFRIRGADDVDREIAVTALPLIASRDELVGAAAIFWESP
jgi:PAS domain-containing protein